jgi:hypothetical protein
VVAAKDFETFGEAILKKLITEIASNDRQRANSLARAPTTTHRHAVVR